MVTAVAILVDGVDYAAWLFIVAVGLTLIYGVMKVLNVAHGALYSLGAYAAAWSVGLYFDRGWAPAGSFLLLALAAVAVGCVVGFVLERGLLRFFYGSDDVLIVLVTYAAFLILENLVLQIWGVEAYPAYQPASLLGTLTIAGVPFNGYELMLVPVAAAIGGTLIFILARTRTGKKLRAVIHDREMALTCGIDVGRFYLATFIAGAVLGALGGALTAPIISVVPGIGVEVIVLAFAVVVTGGLGSVTGSIVGALIVGIARAAAVHLLPQVDLFVIYAAMTIVLILRPEGLFAQAQQRRI